MWNGGFAPVTTAVTVFMLFPGLLVIEMIYDAFEMILTLPNGHLPSVYKRARAPSQVTTSSMHSICAPLGGHEKCRLPKTRE